MKDRIEDALRNVGSEHEPPPGWEARVLASVGPTRFWPRYRPYLCAVMIAVLVSVVFVAVATCAGWL